MSDSKPGLAKRLDIIKPSPSIAANAMVAELQSQGREIINFTLGEPDLDTPSHILEAAKEAMYHGDTHYTPSLGTIALRQAIVEKLSRDNQLDYDISEVVVGTGGKHVIYHAFAATLNPGNEVIVPTPYWVSYPDIALLNEATPVFIETSPDNGFKLTPEQLDKAITPNTKWVVLNSPNNPSGAVYSSSELTAIADVLRRHPHVWILSDEIYEHFVYAPAEHISPLNVAPDLRDRTLILNGVSKGYAMTGWRIGFGAGPRHLIVAIGKLISQTTTCPSSVSQAAAVAAFSGDQTPISQMREKYQNRRDLVHARLSSVDGISCHSPDGAFYIYLDVSGLLGCSAPNGSILSSDDDVVAYFLESAGVAMVSGKAYGQSPFIRVSFASSEAVLERGCDAILKACQALSR
ncbi:pyridoxal phosphate-dependent aminotransferase [Halomonas sp. HAL1]|uniref:pyridoxal phosphate-dependent aminotransferase n=1 Tax=Halomonas sp. HAL1 TaxID=550984 RepID=UPI00022D299B|nr:pyridoxal phosphate-dependent aminotransferase [Halomonas sp. HAL1]EHA14899.1 aspartate aminotransferase [Halomonas sp. HAL1]WKV94175.1 pyridoxal phosphate-dependent aminotransferase [Halomonas sp. HAL1]